MFRTYAVATAIAGLALAGTSAGEAPAMPSDHPACTDDQIAMRVVPESGGGVPGGYHHRVELTNVSAGTCVLKGYPGVDHRAPDGTTVGAPATRAEAPVSSVVLAPQRTAYARLLVTSSGPLPDCTPVAAEGFQLWMPNGTVQRAASVGHTACANPAVSNLTVWPVRA
ncbi:DUF4232 domain-containing protein [Naumannella sp. ID2617S]|nr:DUF4232 domain-containing protein [Naumannella sp. ID2617S]